MELISPVQHLDTAKNHVFPEVDKSFHRDLLSWAGQIIGKEDITEQDLHDGFVFLQIVYSFLPSSFDIRFHSSPDAQQYKDLRTRNFNILATILDKEFSQSIPVNTLKSAIDSESDALNEILSLLKAALEINVDSVPPAAEVIDSGMESSHRITRTKESDYDISDYSFKLLVRWILRFACRFTTDQSQKSRLSQMENSLRNQTGTISRDIMSLLCSSELYELVANIIFHVGPQEDPLAFMDILMKHHYLNYRKSSFLSAKGMIKESSPFYESIHANIILAFMHASTKDVAVGDIVSHMSRFPSFDPDQLYPFDLEDALLIWCNQCIDLYRDVMTNSVLEEIDDLLVGIENGETLFAMICAYHPDAINWEVEDYHTASHLAVNQLSDLHLPWNPDEIEDRLFSNKTQIKALVKTFMIDLLKCADSQYPANAKSEYLKSETTTGAPVFHDTSLKAPTQSEGHNENEFSKLPPIRNSMAREPPEEPQFVEVYSPFPPTESLPLPPILSHQNTSHVADFKNSSNSADDMEVATDIATVERYSPEGNVDSKDEEALDKFDSQAFKNDEIDPPEENDTMRHQEYLIELDHHRLESNEYKNGKEGSVQSRTFELEIEEEQDRVRAPGSDMITMQSNLAKSLLLDVDPSSSEEDCHDPPQYEIANDHYESDDDYQREEVSSQSIKQVQLDTQGLEILPPLEKLYKQHDIKECEWEDVNDEVSGSPAHETLEPLPEEPASVGQAEDDSEWETEQEETEERRRKSLRRRMQRTGRRLASNHSSAKSKRSPNSARNAPIENVISVSVSASINDTLPAKKRITEEKLHHNTTLPPPKNQEVVESKSPHPESPSKKNGLVFIPLDNDSPSSKRTNRVFSRMPSRTGSASTHRSSGPVAAPEAESVDLVRPKPDENSSVQTEIAGHHHEERAPTESQAENKKGVPKQKQLTNRTLIRNALVHVCLAGTVNGQVKQDVLEALDASPDTHFLILFRQVNNFSFRGLYAMDPQCSKALKIYKSRQGPDVIEASGIAEYYKYDSGARTFKVVPTRSLGKSVHAFALSGAVKYTKKRPAVSTSGSVVKK